MHLASKHIAAGLLLSILLVQWVLMFHVVYSCNDELRKVNKEQDRKLDLVVQDLERLSIDWNRKDGVPLQRSPDDNIPKDLNLGNVQIKVDVSLLPYNLAAANGKANSGFWSQAGQDKIVDELLQGATGLFFVESGGYDGEEHSNSLFFEHDRGWRGMVIEPNPHLYAQILGKHRHCMTVNAAISPHDHHEQLPFVLAGPLGGLASMLSEKHQKRLEGEIAAKKSWMDGDLGSGKTIMVPSFPLEWLLKAGKQKSLVVDYWSLDTEGSEPQILSATNFSRIQVGVMSIEHNGEEDKQRGIRNAMVSTGLVLYRDIGFDYIYVNPTYFRERGWNLSLPIA
jgi:hypothetical protein